MLAYLLKRIVLMVPTLLLVALMVFLLVHFIPGDPAIVMVGGDATPEALEQVRRSLGLDQPQPVQFVTWFGHVVTGDLGRSIGTGIPVFETICERFPTTFVLTTLAMLFSVALAVPSGVLAAKFRNTGKDYLFMLVSLLGVSLPGFWLGLMALLVFSVQLGWFPSSGYVPIWQDPIAGLRYMTLPSITLGFFMAAVVARMTRSSMLEVMRLEYVTHARAKGLTEWSVLLKHALKNAFAPTLTTIGIQYGMLLGGAVVTETVFGLPGLGRFVVTAIYSRDYPAVQGCILFIALVYMFVNLAVDVLYKAFDPRVKY
jgi:peptide/nickel transport system permease protein